MASRKNPIEDEREQGRSSAVTIPRRARPRNAYCPFCGLERTETPVNRLRHLEDALCPGRCSAAWQALEALRLRESVSERVAVRRRNEYESQLLHLPALSELLLRRWRAGDWTVSPEDLLPCVQAEEAEPLEADEGASCASAD